MSAPATNRRIKVKNIIDNIKRSSDVELSPHKQYVNSNVTTDVRNSRNSNIHSKTDYLNVENYDQKVLPK